jgi:hypothetical protein
MFGDVLLASVDVPPSRGWPPAGAVARASPGFALPVGVSSPGIVAGTVRPAA